MQKFESRVTDHQYMQALTKLTGVKFPRDVKTMEQAMHYVTWEDNRLVLPVEEDMSNFIIVYERMSPVSTFVNASATSKYNNELFDIMDSFSEANLILYDSNFKSPDNLFVASNGTALKRYVRRQGIVITGIWPLDNQQANVKQLISLKSFLDL